MIPKYFRIIASIVFVSLLTLILCFCTQPLVRAQTLPNLGWSENEISSESYVPVFTRGNLDVSPVFLDGKIIGAVSSFIQLQSDKNENQASSYNSSTRSHLIHSKLQKILNNMSRYSHQVLPKQGISQLEEQEKELRKQLITNFSDEKGNAFVSVTFPQDDVPEIVYSVTQADIERPRFGGSQPLNIAGRAANLIDNVLIQAWKERQSTHLLAQGQRAIIILLCMIIISLSIGWGQKKLSIRQRNINDSLSNSETVPMQDNWIAGLSKVTKGLTVISPKFEKLYLRQRYSLNALYRSGLFWAQWLIWMIGIGYLTSLFYWSRPFSNWIVGVTIHNTWGGNVVNSWPPGDWLLSWGREATLGTPLFILMLVIGTRLAIKIGNVFSDFVARNWSEKKSIQRHTLRASTLATAFKGWLRAVIYLLLGMTIFYHLHQLGTITRAVAVFLGFLSFALSLASQNLLKDLIAGLLILWEDQYAVGDVIVVGDQGGLVEKITLRVTQLRNLEGELITIPNGSIDVVRNLSSEWSRVNYAIEIGYDADVERVLALMEIVAQQMYQDSQWQEQILEEPQILGVDNISHTGILVRLLIKTLPLQQWSVAREFRLRLKKAFDQEGIEIGIPRQIEMHVSGNFPKKSNGSFKSNGQYQSKV